MQGAVEHKKGGLVGKAFSLILVILLNFIFTAQAQDSEPGGNSTFLSRYISRLINDTTDASRPRFLIYPTLAFSPETSWEIGLSSLYVYHARRDTTNRMSEINGFTFFTLENQYGLWFDHANYTDRNNWFFLGRLRYQSFPLLYYGIGPDSPPDYLARVDANQLQFRERILRKIYKNVYIGFQLDFQRLSSVRFVPSSGEALPLPLGSEGSDNLGFGAGVVYDTRHNVLNVREGFFSELAFLQYASRWGSDYSFTSVFTDTRIYKAVNSRDVLAFQLLGEFNIGDVPFNQLALMGGESMMRGYYLGRYRDKNQLASQLEYRFLPLPLGFSNRIGAAVFGGAGTVFNKQDGVSFDNIVLSGGVGLRYLLFPKRDISTRLDIAFTRETPGIYIFIGEAF